MTIIRFGELDDNRWLTVEGHAGYAEAGKDIVCAGVSITAQGLAATLCQAEGVMCEVQKGDGRIFIACRSNDESKRYVDAVFDMACTSFGMLAEAYPNHIKMI